jgi:lysozyme family protein
MARIAKSLAVLRDQVNARWPNRSKVSDGWIGDPAHAARASDHNPNATGVVTALDITHDPAHGVDAGKIAETLRQHKDPRIKYVISNSRIFSSKVSPWQWRPYTGANAHTKHVHVSVDADPALYDSAATWALNVGAPVSRFDECVAHVLKHEGGLVNHPSDPGGLTNMGITIAVFRENVPGGTADDLRRLTVDQAKAIYRKRYWDALKCDQFPAGVDYAVFDFGVNSGISRAADFMTRIKAIDPRGIINELCDARLAYLKKLDTFAVFGRGWTRRVSEVRATALAMAGQRAVTPEVIQTVGGGGAVAAILAWLGAHPVVIVAAVVAVVALIIYLKRKK